jgi:hypothetical protein
MTVLYIFLYYMVAYIEHNGDVSLEKNEKEIINCVT